MANQNLTPCGHGSQNSLCITSEDRADPFYPRFWEDRLIADSLNCKIPKGVFVCDMGELFGDWIPREWQDAVFRAIERNPQHRFYLLTKQPQNLNKFSPFPDNCWVGVTVTNRNMAYDAYVALKEIKTKMKYVSIEPLLEPLEDFTDFLCEAFDWVIIGAQTKPTILPKLEWIEEIILAADKTGLPIFLKNNLWDLLYTEAWDNDIFWANERATLRQEMPKEVSDEKG